MQAASLLYPSPSDTFILLIPYLILFEWVRESLIDPVRISCNSISPEVDAEAINYSLLIHAIEVTDPEWPFNLRYGYFYLFIFISHILTVLLTEPAAINLDLGENIQQFKEEGYSFPL